MTFTINTQSQSVSGSDTFLVPVLAISSGSLGLGAKEGNGGGVEKTLEEQHLGFENTPPSFLEAGHSSDSGLGGVGVASNREAAWGQMSHFSLICSLKSILI